MKKIILVIFSSVAILSANAQNATDKVSLIQSEYALNKKQIIVDQMKFTEEESAKFWPVYDKYEIARKDLSKKRVDNLFDYANNYDHLTNEKASELIRAAFDNRSSLTKLQQDTFEEMANIITPVRAAQYIQIEVFLETMVRMEIADAIPLIQDVESKKK